MKSSIQFITQKDLCVLYLMISHQETTDRTQTLSCVSLRAWLKSCL